jgi:hypothetical protein
MKRIVILGVAIAIVLFAVISWAANNEKDNAAVIVADKWLTLVDSGKYSESWREANEYFRNSVKQDQWATIVQPVRTSLGNVISRKLKAKIYKKASPGEPQGQYIIIQYETSFKNKKSVIEEVVAMFEKNGRWRVSGYHLR